MRRIRVGLIDSGPCSGSLLSRADFADFTANPAPDVIDKLGHGSAVAQVITRACPAVELVVARVFDDRPVCSAASVSRALDWLCTRQVALVNMSFGLRANRAVLQASCERAAAAGVILVAASPAQGDPVYPSALGCVIRATGDARCKPGELSFLRTAQADFGACVRHTAIPVAGSSIGCAATTGVFAAAMAEYGDAWFARLGDRYIHYFGPERRSGTAA